MVYTDEFKKSDNDISVDSVLYFFVTKTDAELDSHLVPNLVWHF